MNAQEFLDSLRNKYATPGCYPTYYYTADGGYLCHDCASTNRNLIVDALLENDNTDGWFIVNQDTNDGDIPLQCDHCYKEIESAYS